MKRYYIIILSVSLFMPLLGEELPHDLDVIKERLFTDFSNIGLKEEFVYQDDRVPSDEEIAKCLYWYLFMEEVNFNNEIVSKKLSSEFGIEISDMDSLKYSYFVTFSPYRKFIKEVRGCKNPKIFISQRRKINDRFYTIAVFNYNDVSPIQVVLYVQDKDANIIKRYDYILRYQIYPWP